MHLLTVTHFFESHGGGIERVAGKLCREFAAAGHTIVWAASAADAAPTDPAISSVALPCINPTERLTGLPMPIPGLTGLRQLDREVRAADAVIIHDALYVTSIAARLLAWRRRKPAILIQHIAEIPFASRILRAVMRLANAIVTAPMLRSAHQVVFISDTVRTAFAKLPLAPVPLLLFNGVDTSIFKPGPGDREALALPLHGTVAAFAGRFVEKKGLHAIQAFARARPDITIAMAGSGPIDPADWGLANVRRLGSLDQLQLANLYRSADFLLLPSVGEGFPLVIQEAMACALPVVCAEESTRADPNARAYLRGVDADPNSHEAIAQAIDKALADLPDEKLRKEMAIYAASSYTWTGMADQLLNVATGLVRQSGTPPH